MIIKICGLKNADNIKTLVKHPIDMIGIIFYPTSPRYINNLDFSTIKSVPKYIKKVGVFVNQTIDEVLKKQECFQLDYIQLHGFESEDYCNQLKFHKIKIIKAFQVHKHFDFSILYKYQYLSDYFLFDTKSSLYGGTGKSFDWSLLKQYKLKTPFLLSGGIGLKNITEAINLTHPQLVGFDINSKIEINPGLKSIRKAKIIITKIRKNELYKTK